MGVPALPARQIGVSSPGPEEKCWEPRVNSPPAAAVAGVPDNDDTAPADVLSRARWPDNVEDLHQRGLDKDSSLAARPRSAPRAISMPRCTTTSASTWARRRSPTSAADRNKLAGPGLPPGNPNFSQGRREAAADAGHDRLSAERRTSSSPRASSLGTVAVW